SGGVADRRVRLEELLLRVELEGAGGFLLAGDVRRRAGGDEHRAGRQRDQRLLPIPPIAPLLPLPPFPPFPPFPPEDHLAHRAAIVGDGFDRVEILREDDSFFERL